MKTFTCSIFGQIESVVADSMVAEGKVKKIEPKLIPDSVRYKDGMLAHCALVFTRRTEAEFDRRVAKLRM